MSAYADLSKLDSSRHCLRRLARHEEPQFSKDSIINVMEKFVKTVNVMDDTILVPCRLMDRQVGDSTDIIPAPGKDSTSNQLTLNSSFHGKRGAVKSKNVHEFLNSSELFNLYNVLNALKNDLLWTSKDVATAEEDDFGSGNANAANGFSESSELKTEAGNSSTEMATASAASTAGTPTVTVSTSVTNSAPTKGHVRRPSTASVASTTSVSNLSDSESEISNENDSGVESEGNKSDNAQSSADSISSSEDVCGQKKAANVDKATDLAKRCRRHLNGLYQCLEQMTEAANYLTARYQSDIGPV